jgi:hypothetical protein
MMEMAHQDDYIKFAVSSANPQEALRELAERTGGFIIANTNNTDKLLAHVMEEVDTHYEIAYPPKSDRDDGHFRKIEVKLARAGFRVETRSGYFAVPDTAARPVTPEEMAGLRALDTQAPSARLRVPLAGLSLPRCGRQGTVCHRLRDAYFESDADARGNRAQAPVARIFAGAGEGRERTDCGASEQRRPVGGFRRSTGRCPGGTHDLSTCGELGAGSLYG